MNDLKGSRVLITGGAGLVGSHITDHLLKENVDEVVIIDNLLRGRLDNLEEAFKSDKVRFVQGDIRDIALLDNLFNRIDYCYHMAALRITRCAENPREAMDVMINGTFNILEACVKHKIKKLVAASSASVLGTADIFPTKETHHLYNNHTFYGASKVANEQMCRSFFDMYGLVYNAMRYFNIYGKRMDREGKYTEVMIRWYYLIKEGKQPLIFGDGKQTMDFIYIDDIARANILALKSNAADEVFNVASGVETSLVEMCYTLLEVMNSKNEPKFVPLPEERQKVEVSRRLADTTKAKELIGFESKISLKEGLQKLVTWLDEITAKGEIIL